MPFFYQQNINEHTHFAVWKITEPLAYFEEEMELLIDIPNEERKRQHLAVRWLFKLMMPEIDLSQIVLAPNGKPCIPNAHFHFSFSHCAGYAACAISEIAPIGIDIEILHDRINRVAKKFLHQEELLIANQLPEDVQLKQLGFYWAAKEAMYKLYEKNGIDFAKDFLVTDLILGEQGNAKAKILHQSINKELSLAYHFKEAYVCVVGYT